eukprot:scaffold17133_cov43-Phaeocystis_antarctica.AAC.1
MEPMAAESGCSRSLMMTTVIFSLSANGTLGGYGNGVAPAACGATDGKRYPSFANAAASATAFASAAFTSASAADFDSSSKTREGDTAVNGAVHPAWSPFLPDIVGDSPLRITTFGVDSMTVPSHFVAASAEERAEESDTCTAPAVITSSTVMVDLMSTLLTCASSAIRVSIPAVLTPTRVATLCSRAETSSKSSTLPLASIVSSIEGGVGCPLARNEVGDRSKLWRDGEAQRPQVLWQASRISELSSHCLGVTPLQADAGKLPLWASTETPRHPSDPASLLTLTPASMHSSSMARALPSEGEGEGNGDAEGDARALRDKVTGVDRLEPIVATPLAKSPTFAMGANPPAPTASSAVPSSDQLMSGTSSCQVGDGTGKDEGAGVDWQDESLQLPLSSVLNSCAAHLVRVKMRARVRVRVRVRARARVRVRERERVWARARVRVSAAHQDFAHQAWSQMNSQSDAIAARGGSYLAYQSFIEELAAPIVPGAELIHHAPAQFVAHESAVRRASGARWVVGCVPAAHVCPVLTHAARRGLGRIRRRLGPRGCRSLSRWRLRFRRQCWHRPRDAAAEPLGLLRGLGGRLRMEPALSGASTVVVGVGLAPGPLEASLEALAEQYSIERPPVPLRVEEVTARQRRAISVQAPTSVRGHGRGV